MINSKFTIVTFYQFKKIQDILVMQNELSHFCKFNKIKGTIILAEEGINGTIAGISDSINKFESYLLKIGFDNYSPKYSYSKFMPFFRLKVRHKKEIVTLRTRRYDNILYNWTKTDVISVGLTLNYYSKYICLIFLSCTVHK